MLTINSKTDKDKVYFFECLGYIKPEHLGSGLFTKIPGGKLESTLVLNTPNPLEKNKELLIDIIKDCDNSELIASYDAENFIGVYRYLRSQGVFELPYRIHTLNIKR